ncbi:phosphohydrolase, partial [Salmonella enterica subsp. enterica serovar Muenchen]|nr:phosphohydrolase [Salmonella enterica subsp. enterica serovar Orion]EHX7074182.1 phosphohydrolase [Salmonella enterica subsp. enterica serovar Muenchen]
LAAAETRRIFLRDFPDFPAEKLAGICHAIEAHSFSAKIAPTTPEAKIVQDADRLEALGAIGLARVFAVSGALGVALFDADDPFADRRPLNDKQFALDHFQTKLLKLPLTMQTERGKYLAQRNADFLVSYMAKLSAELKGDYETRDEAVIQMFATHQ